MLPKNARAGSGADDDNKNAQNEKENASSSHHNKRTRQHSIYTTCTYPRAKTMRYIDSEMTSSLTLQKLLYFNIFQSIMFFYLYLGIALFRWKTFTNDSMFVENMLRIILLFAPWLILEIFRLQNGYEGNLKETFPELFSFILQTLVNLAVMVAFLIFKNKLPLEAPLCVLQIIFMSLEIFVTIFSFNRFTKAQSALFYYKSPYSSQKTSKKDDIELRTKEYERMFNEQQYDADDQDENTRLRSTFQQSYNRQTRGGFNQPIDENDEHDRH